MRRAWSRKPRVRRLKTFLLMDLRDKLAFAHAWFVVVSAKAGIQTVGLARTLKLLSPLPLAGEGGAKRREREDWPRAALWLNLAARYCPGGAKCLPRSVALLALLRRAGIACELRIGVGKTEPALEAHAWVEVNGAPVNDTDDVGERYSAFEPSIAAS